MIAAVVSHRTGPARACTDPAHDLLPPLCRRCGKDCEPYDAECWACGCPELRRCLSTRPVETRRDAYVAL